MPNSFEALEPKERYAIILGRVEHEHELSNARMQWLLTFQGFLFATLAVAESGKHYIAPTFFFKVVPAIGALSALTVLAGIIASGVARRRLKLIWEEGAQKSGFPNISPSPLASILGRLPGIGVPIILIAAWLWLLSAQTPALIPPAAAQPVASATVSGKP